VGRRDLHFCGQNSIDTQDHSSYTPTVKKQCFINSINTNQFIREGIPGVEIRELSMGMSDNLEVASEDGTT
jgi:uncharacterized pyridoxal phosphate-containing UPF0001 family protein